MDFDVRFLRQNDFLHPYTILTIPYNYMVILFFFFYHSLKFLPPRASRKEKFSARNITDKNHWYVATIENNSICLRHRPSLALKSIQICQLSYRWKKQRNKQKKKKNKAWRVLSARSHYILCRYPSAQNNMYCIMRKKPGVSDSDWNPRSVDDA